MAPTSRHEDVSLLHAARDGDRRALERVVVEHLGLVRSVAAHYRDLGLAQDDLVQEGSVGLLEAIETFDPSRGSDFETYSRFRIRRAIRNALTEQSRLIRLPKQVVERRRAIRRAESALAAATGRAPTLAELSTLTGLPATVVAQTQAVGGEPMSLDQPMLDDGGSLAGAIADATASDPAAETAEREERDLVDAAVARLPARQREVIARHFGVGRVPEDIAHVANALHLSRQRVRTIERDALYRLRDTFVAPDAGAGTIRRRYSEADGRAHAGRARRRPPAAPRARDARREDPPRPPDGC